MARTLTTCSYRNKTRTSTLLDLDGRRWWHGDVVTCCTARRHHIGSGRGGERYARGAALLRGRRAAHSARLPYAEIGQSANKSEKIGDQ